MSDNPTSPEALDEMVGRCLPRAMGVARRILGDESAAEDAVQEAFLRIVRHRGRYEPGRPFLGWLFAILRNVCVDMLRSRARRSRLAAELAERQDPPAHPPAFGGAAEDLLAGLPKGEADVLVLRIVHELSFREIGQALGISEEAAKKRAQRGLRRLRRSRQALEALGAAGRA